MSCTKEQAGGGDKGRGRGEQEDGEGRKGGEDGASGQSDASLRLDIPTRSPSSREYY